MKKMKTKNFGKIIGIISVLLISITLISSATAVPNIQGSKNIKIINQQKQMEKIISTLENLEKIDEKDTEQIKQATFILALFTEQLSISVKNNKKTIDAVKLVEKIENKNKIEINDITNALSNSITNTEKIIDDKIKNEETKHKRQQYQILKTNIQKIKGSVDTTDENNINLLELLKSLISAILTVLSVILSIVLKIVSSIVRIIGTLVKLVLFMLAGLQVALIFAAFFILYIGFLSVLGIKVLAQAAAPIFATIAYKMVTLLGKLLANVLSILTIVLAVVVALAIPILIVVAIIVLTQGEQATQILASILEPLFGILLNIPGLEDTLKQIWETIGENMDDWPEWPFSDEEQNITNYALTKNSQRVVC